MPFLFPFQIPIKCLGQQAVDSRVQVWIQYRSDLYVINFSESQTPIYHKLLYMTKFWLWWEWLCLQLKKCNVRMHWVCSLEYDRLDVIALIKVLRDSMTFIHLLFCSLNAFIIIYCAPKRLIPDLWAVYSYIIFS